MQINNNHNKKRQQDMPGEIEEEDIYTKRDLDLENIAGNLMIAEYQVDKLKHRLTQQVRGTGSGSFGNKKTSAHTFKYDGKCYKVSIKVEEMSLDIDNNEV